MDGTSGDDVIGTGFVDDDDDRVDGNDGEIDFIVGEGGGDTISSGAGDDVIYGDHADDLPAGTTEYIAQGFFRDVNFELESGTFNFTDSVVSISDDPLEIRFVDNDGVLNGDTTSSETPDDTDQLVEINGVLYNYSADYVIQMSGSNGQTYDMLVLDVDRDDSGLIDANDPTSDPGDNDYENGQILIPRGDIPPPGVTLTAFGPTYDLVNEDYSNLNGAAVVTNYDDTIDAGAGDDTVFGGQGDDTITGGEGADTLTGGAGADSFIVDDGGDIITDFDTGGGVENGDPTDNDFVDLTQFYNAQTLAAWNAANPDNQYSSGLAWLRADQQDGPLDQAGGLQLQNDGSAVAASELNAENTGVVCFTKGTLIATARGEVPVETLQVGDLVQTMDHGLQPIRWIGARHLKQTDLAEEPKLRPIRISSTVMGLPDHEQDLVVSPQHRILVSSKIAQRMLGDGEVLIAANKLLGLDGVDVASDKSAVTYYHVLCDAHEILFANGIPAESLYLGNEALKSLTPEGLAEIRALFPELVGKDVTPRFCRTVVSGSRAKNLCRRHAKNHKPLIEYGASMRSGIAPDSAFGTAATGLGAKGITPGATPVAYAAE